MSVAFAIMCICFGIAFLLAQSMKKDQKQERANGVILSDHFAKYIGGLPDVAGGKDATLYIKEDRVILEILGSNLVGKSIEMNDIIKAEIQSESQINQCVSLGKLVMFGVLAFGMKKKSEINNYLLLSYKENSEERNLILESQQLESITRMIRKYAFN